MRQAVPIIALVVFHIDSSVVLKSVSSAVVKGSVVVGRMIWTVLLDVVCSSLLLLKDSVVSIGSLVVVDSAVAGVHAV